MATDLQFAANRANAQLSTGPLSEAGKAAVSQNAGKHYLTSKYLIILSGQEDDFAELESGLRSKLKPAGPLEELLFKRIVECAWNLERCRHAEFELFQQIGADRDPLSTTENAPQFDRIHRYARQSENSMYKAMRELGKLQSEQQFRDEAFPPAGEDAESPANPISSAVSMQQIVRNVVLYRKNSHQAFEEEQRNLFEMARNRALPNKANLATAA